LLRNRFDAIRAAHNPARALWARLHWACAAGGLDVDRAAAAAQADAGLGLL